MAGRDERTSKKKVGNRFSRPFSPDAGWSSVRGRSRRIVPAMNPRAFCRLAARLMRHPAPPYHEHAVSAEVESICRENELSCEKDAFGNLLVRSSKNPGRGSKLRPIVFAAHMDHPGFEVLPSPS